MTNNTAQLSLNNWIKMTGREGSRVKFLLYPGCESQLTMDLMSFHEECLKRWPLETHRDAVIETSELSDALLEIVRAQGPQNLRTERVSSVVLAIAWADNQLVDKNEQPRLGDIVNAMVALLDDSDSPEH